MSQEWSLNLRYDIGCDVVIQEQVILGLSLSCGFTFLTFQILKLQDSLDLLKCLTIKHFLPLSLFCSLLPNNTSSSFVP